MLSRDIQTVILALVLVFAALIPGESRAAPAVTNVSGTFAQGATITVSGSGFGAKSPAAPVLWAPFDASLTPSSLGRITSWDTTDQYPRCVVYAAGEGRTGGGVKTSDACGKTDTAELWIRTGSIGYIFNTLDQKSYLYRSRKMGYSDDVNLKSLEIMEYNNYTLGNNLVFNHSTSQWISQNISNDSFCYMDPSPVVNMWATEELVAETATVPNVDSLIRWYANGALLGQSPSCEIAFRDNPGADMDVIKPIFHGDYNTSGGSMAATPEWWDDVYVDDTWARVMLGDAPTYAASTEREIQIPTAWGDTALTLSANLGQFTTGTAYLYVVDSTGAVNGSGYPITVGGPPDTTPPASPVNLSIQ